MMAAAGRESHRSSDIRLLSPPNGDDEGGARSRAETVDESIAGGGPGPAGLEADVGTVDALLGAVSGQQPQSRKAKKRSKRGGKNTAAAPADRATPASTPAAAAAAAAAVEAAASGGGDGGESGGTPADVAGAGGKEVEEARVDVKSRARARSQQLYERFSETQEKLRTMRDERATAGCTFAPQLSSKQKDRKSEEDVTPDHLYKDFKKQLEKREQLAEEEGKKLSFRPVLPTASSRLAAKVAANTPAAGQKSAHEKSKATAEAMYKECTFQPDTVRTKGVSKKILAAKGEQAPVADRLYQPAEAQAAVVKSREEARAAQELGACTFRPDMSSTSKRSSSGSGRQPDSGKGKLHDRLFGLHGEMLMSKQTKREELAARELMACTFSPTLVAKPATAAAATKTAGKSPFSCLPFAAANDDDGDGSGERGRQSVHERLYSARGRTKTREAFVDSECTFQPKLSLSRNKSARGRGGKAESCDGSDRDGEGGGGNRLDAMYNKGKLRQTARSQSPSNYTAVFLERDEEKELELCTFQPNVSHTQKSRFKVGSRGRALFDSLYSKREDHFEVRERIRKEDMKECTFSPELASHKTRLGRSLSPQRQRPVFEDLYHEADTQRLARSMSAENLQAQQCPFKPQLVARSRAIPGREKSPTAAAAAGAGAGTGASGSPGVRDRWQQQDYAAPAGEYWPSPSEYDGYGNSGGVSSASAGRGDNAGAAGGQYGAGAGAGAAGGYGASQAGGYSAQPPQGPPQPVADSRGYYPGEKGYNPDLAPPPVQPPQGQAQGMPGQGSYTQGGNQNQDVFVPDGYGGFVRRPNSPPPMEKKGRGGVGGLFRRLTGRKSKPRR